MVEVLCIMFDFDCDDCVDYFVFVGEILEYCVCVYVGCCIDIFCVCVVEFFGFEDLGGCG